jgi:type IV pilus assembly protein PilC
MARYAYQARSTNGKDIRGEIEAGSEQEARIKLRAQRLMPISVVAQSGAKAQGGKKAFSLLGGTVVKAKDLQVMTRQLSTLVGSGIPILQSLDVLSRGSRSTAIVDALKTVVTDVSKGKRLGDSMAEHPTVFDRFYVNMVRAGEESGNLDQILNRLAAYIEKSVKLQGKVKGALIYPIAILVVASIVVAGLLVFVIPKFQALFSGSGNELPAMTLVVIAISKWFIAYWWSLAAVVFALIVGFSRYYRTEAGREKMDNFAIGLPLFGDLIQKNAIARFTRTLGTLITSGVGIMEAIEISSRVVGNHVIEMALMRAKESIAEGKSLTAPLSKEKYIPAMVTQMIGVGEQTGNLDQMLGRIADFYEDEVDVAVGALTSLLEPLLMVVLGIIIAFLVIAMYLPIFNLAGSVG